MFIERLGKIVMTFVVGIGVETMTTIVVLEQGVLEKLYRLEAPTEEVLVLLTEHAITFWMWFLFGQSLAQRFML